MDRRIMADKRTQTDRRIMKNMENHDTGRRIIQAGEDQERQEDDDRQEESDGQDNHD